MHSTRKGVLDCLCDLSSLVLELWPRQPDELESSPADRKTLSAVSMELPASAVPAVAIQFDRNMLIGKHRIDLPLADPIIGQRLRDSSVLAERAKQPLELAANHRRSGDFVERAQQLALSGGCRQGGSPAVQCIWRTIEDRHHLLEHPGDLRNRVARQ